jgi:membrane protein implicated in regulation of membrane protease activity
MGVNRCGVPQSARAARPSKPLFSGKPAPYVNLDCAGLRLLKLVAGPFTAESRERMEVEAHVWWVVAGISLIIAEMLSGTLLLLVLGVAALSGGLAAWLGLGFGMQALIAVMLAAIGMIVLSSLKKRKEPGEKGEASLDVGHTVILDSWVNEAAGVAKVRYRNATWDAKVTGPHSPGTTVFYICATDGNTLHISSTKPSPVTPRLHSGE